MTRDPVQSSVLTVPPSGGLTGLALRHLGRSGSTLPVEAWYDGTCFLDTPSCRHTGRAAARSEANQCSARCDC